MILHPSDWRPLMSHGGRLSSQYSQVFIGATQAEPYDEIWWSEGSTRSSYLYVHSLTTGATQVSGPSAGSCKNLCFCR